MFVFYTGKPGTGKSYKVVFDLFRIQGQYYVIHNIDGLKHEAFKQPYLFKDWRTYISEEVAFSEFEIFTEQFQQKLTDEVWAKFQLPVLVVIDEAHRWFDKSKKDLKAWLSFHRHLGQDIWMVTQKQTMIHNDFRGLAELEKRAKNTFFFNLPYLFVYQKRSGTDSCGYETARKKKKIFQAYKSFEISSSKSKKSSLFVPVLIGLVLVGLVYFFAWPSSHQGGKKVAEASTGPKPKKVPVQKVVKPDKLLNQEKKKVEEVETDQQFFSSEVEKIVKTYNVCGVAGGDVWLVDPEGSIHNFSALGPDYKIQKIYPGRYVDVMQIPTRTFFRLQPNG